MRAVFTQEELNVMVDLQKKLDERIMKENGISSDQDLSLEKFLALKTELFELANEVEEFKFWKKNKGKSNQLEEACDVLHFILSIAIDNNIELKEIKQNETFNANNYDMNTMFGMMDCMISDMFIENNWEEISVLILLLGVIVNKCGYDIEDLYKCYKDKNEINHKRQDEKY